MKEGPRMRNTEAVRLLSLRIIGEADLLLLLQSSYDGFLIYSGELSEVYVINWLISKVREIIIL